MKSGFQIPAGAITIQCRAPGPERRQVRRELKNAVRAFARSKKTNRPIVGFRPPR